MRASELQEGMCDYRGQKVTLNFFLVMLLQKYIRYINFVENSINKKMDPKSMES
jgi:hypothetical protein